MRFLSCLATLTVLVAACSSNGSNPCGTDPYANLPACTPALEGTTCTREACACCTDSWVCHSGEWVGNGINGESLCAEAGTD
jgi:hypothetical protein